MLPILVPFSWESIYCFSAERWNKPLIAMCMESLSLDHIHQSSLIKNQTTHPRKETALCCFQTGLSIATAMIFEQLHKHHLPQGDDQAASSVLPINQQPRCFAHCGRPQTVDLNSTQERCCSAKSQFKAACS